MDGNMHIHQNDSSGFTFILLFLMLSLFCIWVASILGNEKHLTEKVDCSAGVRGHNFEIY